MIFTPKKGTNIYKRKDGRWEARYLKSINQDGKRIYGSVYGKTFDEAKRKQEEAVQNHSKITKKTSRVVLILQKISAEWKDSIKQTVKESTYLKYDTIIRKHILSHDISTVNISNLTTKEIHEFSEQLCKEGLSAKTVNDILVVLGLILKYAEDIYKISKPKIKYIKVQKKELRVLSSQEQMVLERFLLQEMDSYKLGILIALYTGIRIGHSDVKTTLNRYVHSTMNQKKKNMDLLVPLATI